MKSNHAFFHNFRRKLAINAVLAIGSSFVTPGLVAQSHSFGTEIALATVGSHRSVPQPTGKTVWPASDGQCTAPSNGEDYSGVQCTGVTEDSQDPTATPLIAFDAGEDYSGPRAATPAANRGSTNYGQSSPAAGYMK